MNYILKRSTQQRADSPGSLPLGGWSRAWSIWPSGCVVPPVRSSGRRAPNAPEPAAATASQLDSQAEDTQ